MNKNRKTVIGTFTGKCCDATVSNNNDMFLGRELFENLFQSEDYKRAMKNRYYIGFLGHPEDPGCMDFRNACIVMTECHIDENGEVYGTFDLIDTPVGRTVKAFIDAGVTFGISIRGAGDIGADGEVDPETFVFRGFDLVTFPAYDDAVPTFKEIAASSNLDEQVKYKKVCSAIKKNLSSITSSEALDVIQEQFNEHSEEYQNIEARKVELQDEDITDNDTADILREKVNGMTTLYLEQVQANNQLRRNLQDVKAQLSLEKCTNSRKIRRVEQITASQLKSITSELDKITASYDTQVAANRHIKSELEKVKEQNLKYVHKIKANSQTICDRDSTISDLKAELRKTVTANSKLESGTSNLDEKVKNLQSRVEAAEQMVLNYQQAYANMYANALGVHLDNLPITASTTVSELQKMIRSGTSTANISSVVVEPHPIEISDDIDGEDDMVTL